MTPTVPEPIAAYFAATPRAALTVSPRCTTL
jgi:hypothetical protein